MQLELILPVPTSLNELYENQYVWNPIKKMRVPTGARVMSAKGEKVKKEIQEAARSQMIGKVWDYEYTLTDFLYMDVYIIFSRMGRDDNNIFKLSNDSLEKIVYDNDSRILTRTQRILYDTVNPHIRVVFTQTPHVGIFENKEEFEEFHNRCLTCMRHKNNCSILVKAKEARIQEDIDGKVCLKFKEIKIKKGKIKGETR